MPRSSSGEWLGSTAAAEHLGIGLSTLWRLVDEGKVPAYRPSRRYQFRRGDLDAYLESTRVKPGTVAHLRSDQRRNGT